MSISFRPSIFVALVVTVSVLPLAANGQSPTSADAAADDHRQSLAELARVTKARFAEAKTDEEKNAIRIELKQRLTKAFATDMREREKRAAEIEVRLSKLRDQYQAREKKKEEIIELQAKAIELDADDLGASFNSVAGLESSPPSAADPYDIENQRPLEQ